MIAISITALICGTVLGIGKMIRDCDPQWVAHKANLLEEKMRDRANERAHQQKMLES